MLNRLWLSFFFLSFLAALWTWLGQGDGTVFSRLVQSSFDMAKLSVEVSIGLAGTLTLWLGLLKVAEAGGVVRALARLLAPLFKRLMPEVPAGHPALGNITMNFAANMLGLDNAATPIGLKAMAELQSLNKSADTASNAQILFLVLNTSSLTLFPINVFLFRAQAGAVEPTDVFLPILLATSCSTLVGLICVAFVQRLRIFDPVVLAYFAGAALLISGVMSYLFALPPDAMSAASSVLGNFLLFGTIIAFLGIAAWRKVDVYERFIEGAKEGFGVAVTLIPYLVAMLVAVGVLRASGVLEFLMDGIRALVSALGGDTRFVEALPTALIKPFSGSGARAMLIETMKTHGADSFAARTAAIIQGSTETTFYVVAVYFGSVGIKKVRHAIGCGLLADLAGVLAAIAIAYWFYG
ncbi:MAG: spore maturation protein [Gammaproteobacteria bacterium]|nr:spore maturation protein [Gammaproteobacteria bacterium]